MFLIDWMARWSFDVFLFFFFFTHIFSSLDLVMLYADIFLWMRTLKNNARKKMGERDDNVLSSWEKNDRMTFYVNMKASTTYICRMLTNKNTHRQKNKSTHDHKKQETHKDRQTIITYSDSNKHATKTQPRRNKNRNRGTYTQIEDTYKHAQTYKQRHRYTNKHSNKYKAHTIMHKHTHRNIAHTQK
jgi:hypothetical protein